ncbi:hypothetical protein ET475_03410 [Microbacterium protaetiae]|uniref:Uncharacterized protein n=1 Tax=Microbacterium protaetiae TaxID=2509458 RepID=A0A4V0YD15_9MICO|nr:hypothetical protein [Microbacterium protaetiae]QAY59131.1 hypothetical protein ET475_03410 [Microbacterium protaetiae]
MTGVWEQRLQNIAYGQQFSMPAASELIDAMDELKPLLDKAAQDPGITGTTGLAAADSLNSVSQRAHAVSTTTQQLHDAVTRANDVRTQAQTDAASLGSGSLNGWQEALVRGAAAGATIAFPGFSVIAGEGAVGLVNWFLGNQREDAAKTAVKKASDALDDIVVPEKVDVSQHDTNVNTRGSAPGAGTIPGGTVPGSFANYPGANTPVIDHDNLPRGLTLTNPHPGSGAGTGAGTGRGGGGAEAVSGPVLDDDTPVVIPPGQSVGPGGVLTPNGPNAGGTTWGGGIPGSGGVAGGAGGNGYGVGGVGSGYGSGGSGLLGSAATGSAVAGTSGATLFGGARVAGGGLGAAGAAAGASGRAGGLLGGTRAGGGASVATVSAGAGAGSRSGMVGGGAPGGRGRGENRQEGRGLGGPIAPHLEDEEELGPRSAAAGAGGRD